MSAVLAPAPTAPSASVEDLAASARAFADHPRLREAMTASAARNLDYRFSHDGRVRWLTKSTIRQNVLVSAALRAGPGGSIAASDYFGYLRRRGFPSLSTARRAFEQAETAGLFRIDRQGAGWRGAILAPTPALEDALRRRAVIEIETAAVVAPEIGGFVDRLGDAVYFGRFLAWLTVIQLAPPRLRPPDAPAIRQFMAREVGLPSLYDLYLSQPGTRTRSLESAPFSRLRLAQRFEVSRAHIIGIYQTAERAGLVAFPSPDRIDFSPELSRQWDLHFAGTYAFIRCCAVQAALGPPRFPTGEAPRD